MISELIRNIIRLFGYEIKVKKNNSIRTSISESYSHMRKLGFNPITVIDVGVAKGTPELYSSFPDSFYLLIEPLKIFEKDLIEWLKKIKGIYILAAAGKRSSSVTFNVHNVHLEGSSILKENMGGNADGVEVTVPLIRIDDVIEKNKLKGPYLIKVDVQGAELEALDGAEKTLCEAEVVVLEVSLFEFMRGAPQFFDIILYMKNLGFVTYDIIQGWNRPLDNALGQVDIVFVKENGFFRKDHSYSVPE